jgi:hypothetical protein
MNNNFERFENLLENELIIENVFKNTNIIKDMNESNVSIY